MVQTEMKRSVECVPVSSVVRGSGPGWTLSYEHTIQIINKSEAVHQCVPTKVHTKSFTNSVHNFMSCVANCHIVV